MSIKLHSDILTRRLYATDASMYEETPLAVAFPDGVEALSGLVKQAADKGLSITARAAGTSLAGQATGSGVIADTSLKMNRILEINSEKRYTKVEPGVIRDILNKELNSFGLQFAPDTATANRCMIGGMIGNNSSGLYSIKHKTTREHVLEMEVVLSDGSVVRFGALSEDELNQKIELQTLEGTIYREMVALLKEHKGRIAASFPHPGIIRRNTGYALDKLCEMHPITPNGRPFNFCELLCGSEGTLALTASATLKLVEVPRHKILIVPQFQSLKEALLSTVEAVAFNPSAVELVDDTILNATKGNLEQYHNRFFLENEPACILIIQFEGDDAEQVEQSANALRMKLSKQKLGYTHPIISEKDAMQKVWELRKAGLGLLMGLGKESRSPTFMEDTCVRVQDLPDYVNEITSLLRKHKTHCAFYAHASVGELHIRPVIDTTTASGLETMKEMAREVAQLVKKYRGSLSGEHGDGRVRSPFIEDVFGREIVDLFRRVKTIWDPHGIFNPGKIVDPLPMDSNLRFSPEYRIIKPETGFYWQREGNFANALELCNGAGVCRKLAASGGTMCPSYQATREEKDSTRGRANVFRQVFSGENPAGFESEELGKALELCLSCKACKSECPANVDMAKMKAEFLYSRKKSGKAAFSERFKAMPERYLAPAAVFPKISNAILQLGITKLLMHRFLGIDRSRALPLLAPQSFNTWMSTQKKDPSVRKKQVVLLVDPFTNYFEPEIAIDAYHLFNKLGYDVIVPGIEAIGRAQISKGFLDEAKALANKNLDILDRLIGMGIPIVGLEPSELLTIRDEYPDLCDKSRAEQASRVAKGSYLFEEFMDEILHTTNFPAVLGLPKKVCIHSHCHVKALAGSAPALAMFRKAGFEPEMLNTGCCGMAGSFGYEHADTSIQIAELQLRPALEGISGNSLLCASGFSCRHQIEYISGRKALHPATLLRRHWNF